LPVILEHFFDLRFLIVRQTQASHKVWVRPPGAWVPHESLSTWGFENYRATRSSTAAASALLLLELPY
jgi:hypothetical protein